VAASGSVVPRKEARVLIFSIFIAGVCSIIYELLIATTSSYFLGDSITQFSITIGVYMAAMGVGSYLSRFFTDKKLLENFILIELMLGVTGGLCVPLLYASFAYTGYFQLSSLVMTVAIGVFIGLEIPLLSRLMKDYYTLKDNISNVMSLDYSGALLATLAFPFILLPLMGTFKSSIFFGLVNMSIAVVILWCFAPGMGKSRLRILQAYLALSVLFLATLFMFSNVLLKEWSNSLYTDRIIYTKETPYQKIVMTKYKNDFRLFLNGNLQFSSIDEYRYHEALVHVPVNLADSVEKVLILGGGDGLVVRELLKYPLISSIDLVDLDPVMSKLGKEHPYLRALNKSSLHNKKVSIKNQDAFVYLNNSSHRYDLIIIDLPDPNNTALARLYSKEFYRLVKNSLNSQGLFVTQATSPFFAKEAFWTMFETIKSTGFVQVAPYHVNVPSFGEWGFIIGSREKRDINNISLNIETRYLSEKTLSRLWQFEKDLSYVGVQVSTIDNPKILEAYLKGWVYWN